MPPLPRVYVIRKPGRKFLYLRYRDPDTCREHTRTTNTKDTREAERAAARWETELRQRRELGNAATTWAEFRHRYESEVLASLAEKTDLKATGALASFERAIQPHRLVDVTAERISTWVATLRDGTREETTIAGIVGHLRAALRWAADVGLIPIAPRVPRIRTGKRQSAMRGRPLTAGELDLLLAAAPAVVADPDAAAAWQRLIQGLWLSGLRLSEALPLSWDRREGMLVDLSGRRPMLRIHVEDEKARTDRLLPVTPDFAAFLTEVPLTARSGLVFPLPKEKQRASARGLEMWTVSRVSERISKIGEAAGVIVNDRTGKFASAHDLRRSFGFRWSRLVMPPVLMELMRHANIATTMQFYVGINAESTADTVWEAWEQRPSVVSTSGDTSEAPEKPSRRKPNRSK